MTNWSLQRLLRAVSDAIGCVSFAFRAVKDFCAGRAAVLVLLAGLAACAEPPKQNPAVFYAEHLRDIYAWDAAMGAKGHYAFDAMLASEPAEAVPVLIAKLGDVTPTAVHDSVHDPVPVANVAFHILLIIFAMEPEAFEREGVWVMQSDPSRNPIYTVKFADDQTRGRLASRFHAMAVERGWMSP